MNREKKQKSSKTRLLKIKLSFALKVWGQVMALTSIIRVECKVCGKIANEASRITIGKSTIIKLTCGHLAANEKLASTEETYDSIVFSDGCKPRPYQIDAIKFGEAANCRFILADEQGVGKTIEALCLLRLHPEKLLPAVYICPTTIKLQVMREIHRICGSGKEFLTQVIQSGKEKALPGFKIYVVTYDMLKKPDMFSLVPDIKTVFIDECQRIKNHLSDRAKAVQAIAKNAQHIIPMSGSPIYNNAGEYFTVLNLVDPLRFNQHQRYLDTYCDTYETFYATKIGGLKDADRFHEDTKDIIIRRNKSDVLKDLPELDRKFFHVELDAKLNKAYAAQLQELDDVLYAADSSSFSAQSQIIAIYSRLRHITGISKVNDCVDFVTEFLLSTDRKITIFLHHQDVSHMLEVKLNSWLKDVGFEPVLNLHAGLNGNQRSELAEKFRTGNNRVMLASTQAAGEGLNLQFCSDAVMLERQWNPPREEQAEARFHRFGQLNSVSVTYMLASGTIDEYFTELVERKRAIITSVMDNKEIVWEEQSLMKELAVMLTTKGREKWRL